MVGRELQINRVWDQLHCLVEEPPLSGVTTLFTFFSAYDEHEPYYYSPNAISERNSPIPLILWSHIIRKSQRYFIALP